MLLHDLLGTQLPIIQAPMAGVQGSALAIAVSNAGGLGGLPCAMLSPEALRSELTAIQAGTPHPFNVNFFCHTPPVFDAERQAAWQTLLAEAYLALAVEPPPVSPAGGRVPFDHAAAEILRHFKPPVVSFHFGLPTEDLVRYVRSWGAKILSSATTVEEARWLEAHGADIIIAQGWEAGGHRGMFLTETLSSQCSTLALVPQVVRAVRCPVVAAGGIADAQGVAAVIQLGAVGAQVGTSYLLCPEANTSAVHRAALGQGASTETALTNLFSGRPARSIVNAFMRQYGPLNALAPDFPYAAASVAPLRAKAEAIGSGDFSPLWAGQNTTGCRAIPAAELTLALAQGLNLDRPSPPPHSTHGGRLCGESP